MADVREMRIFAAEQIEVQQDVPAVLKNYSKEVIRQNPQDIIKFSRMYFEQLLREEGYFDPPKPVSHPQHHADPHHAESKEVHH